MPRKFDLCQQIKATRISTTALTQPVNWIHTNYNNLCVKFYTQIFLICAYFLIYLALCVYFYTSVFF